jgi:ubiquinone/menaquinone biosynthesis C-methylase UbiE
VGHRGKRGRAIAPDNKGLLKRIHDSAWAWDLFQGPVYNRLIFKAAADYFDTVIGLAGKGAPARILDVGSGGGVVSLRLAKANPDTAVVGIDYALMQVRAADRLKKKEQVSNCTFKQGNAMALPFSESAFDRVVSVNSIKHWPDPIQGLSEIRRVLRPRGQAFISEADRSASPEELLAFSENYRAWYIWGALMRWILRNVVFGKSYTAAGLKTVAGRAGFSDIIIQVVPGPFFLLVLTK